MSDVRVRPVASRREKRAFLELPWILYRGDPNWIPPLRIDQKEMVGYRPHPFYRNNAVQTFLAYRSGEVCGRIAAILNRDHNEYYSERRGFFGFFECVDDAEVAARLFDPRKAEIYQRLGLQTIAPTTWGIHRMAELLSYKQLDMVLSLGGGGVEIAEYGAVEVKS